MTSMQISFVQHSDQCPTCLHWWCGRSRLNRKLVCATHLSEHCFRSRSKNLDFRDICLYCASIRTNPPTEIASCIHLPLVSYPARCCVCAVAEHCGEGSQAGAQACQGQGRQGTGLRRPEAGHTRATEAEKGRTILTRALHQGKMALCDASAGRITSRACLGVEQSRDEHSCILNGHCRTVM